MKLRLWAYEGKILLLKDVDGDVGRCIIGIETGELLSYFRRHFYASREHRFGITFIRQASFDTLTNTPSCAISSQ